MIASSGSMWSGVSPVDGRGGSFVLVVAVDVVASSLLVLLMDVSCLLVGVIIVKE